jgi:hypothetical protein
VVHPIRAEELPAESTFDHTVPTRFWLSGQANVIFQYHPGFPAKYSGPNSLRPEAESATSVVLTLYSALALHRTSELIFDLELATGAGISAALGLAGMTNLDVVRNPTLGTDPYVARVQLHQIVPLSSVWEPNDRGPLGTLPALPRHRLELRIGKISTVDSFDLNGPASDSHVQFMNWTACNNGAYDFAADTRGYTWGFVLEYRGPRAEVRFGEMLMPTVANGIDLDTDLANAHAENQEVTLHYSLRPGWAGTARALGYVNHARMGNYREAIAAYRAGQDPTPTIEAHRAPGRIKYGVGFNLEQELRELVRAFARFGWNDGATESFAFTEAETTIAIGFDVAGRPWRRPVDRVGVAFISNGLGDDHREYLRLGGKGFLLGDGTLTYGRETILETYYTARVAAGVSVAGDIQAIGNPGYNMDRGPVLVLSARLHLEL